MTVGNNIKKYRKEACLTQAELAKKVGVLQHHVNRWEKNVYIPSIDTIKKIAEELNVSVDGLLFTDKERHSLKITDKELLEKLKDIEKLTQKEKEAIFNLIDSLAAKK